MHAWLRCAAARKMVPGCAAIHACMWSPWLQELAEVKDDIHELWQAYLARPLMGVAQDAD